MPGKGFVSISVKPKIRSLLYELSRALGTRNLQLCLYIALKRTLFAAQRGEIQDLIPAYVVQYQTEVEGRT